MKVVLDTNVIVSAILVRGGNEHRILGALQRGEFAVVLSPHILEEIGRVFAYPKIKRARWVSEREMARLLQYFAEESFFVAGKTTVHVCRDPEDNKFLAAALEAGARYVVTGDKDLLAIGNHQGIDIILPSAFLIVLRGIRKRGP